MHHYPEWTDSADRRSGPVRTTFLGTSTVLIRDDRTALLVDGFFSRPSLRRVATTRIGPDRKIVDACLARAGIDSLDAVICAHAHYDHALDAPLIAARFDAPLIGSESTMNLGRGHGLAERLLRPARDEQTFVFGDFDVTVISGPHSPGDVAPGGIDAPLTPPARYRAWRSDDCYSIFFGHPTGTVHVHASANYVAGKLEGRQADTVYLSVGKLGGQSERFRSEYWSNIVTATGATTVLPVHWDDFFVPLDRPLRPMRHVMDDVTSALDFVVDRSRRDGLYTAIPAAWQEIDPFAHR